MNLITVDVGNSSIGIADWSGGEPRLRRAGTPSAAAAEIAHRPEAHVVLVSVAPGRTRALVEGLAPRRVEVLEQCPIAVADASLRESAGADRLANATAMLPGPGVVVDAGTAVTVDVIDAHGVYVGGFIAPGPALAARGLCDGTERLPLVEAGPTAIAPGLNTHAAIAAGVWGVLVGGVDRLVRAALERAGAEARVVATGAWGAAWADESALPRIERCDAWMHHGIRRWWERRAARS